MLNISSKKRITSLFTLIVFAGLSLTACGNVKDTETLISEARQYQQSGDDNAAIIQLKNALQQEPNNREARFLIGAIYNEIGDPLSAEKELNRSLELGMDANEVMPILGQSLLRIGEFQQLLDKTDELAETNDSISIKLLRANAQFALGMHDEAKGLFDQVLREDPDSPEALMGSARYALTQNDIDLAMRYAAQAARKNPTNTDAWFFLGDLFRVQGKIDRALSAYDRVIKLDPENVSAHINRTTIKINSKEFDAAKESLEAAKSLAPDAPLVIYTQAQLDFNQQDYAAALASIQQVLSIAPDHMPSVLLAGAIQFSLGSLVQAEQYLDQYIKADPNNLYARKLMASVLLRNKQAQNALDILTPALDIIDQDPQLFALAGEAYIQIGDFAKANEFFEKANVLAPDNAALHTALGISMLAQGDSAHAITELQAAIDLDGDSTRAGVLLVMTHLRLQEFDKALHAANSLAKEQPDNPLFQNLKGGVYLGKKDIPSARASFNKALSLQADYFPAISNLARLDLRDENPDAAKKRFEDMLKNDANNIQALNALAQLALSQDDINLAAKWLELASQRNPNELQAAIQLASFYLRIGEKEKPLILAQRLLVTHPDEPRVLEILAQSQLANDQKSAALENYEKIAARLPDSAETQFRIASIHAAMENISAATVALKRALVIKPDYLEAKLAQVRLAVHNKNEDEALKLAKNIQQQHGKLPIGYVLEGDLLMGQEKPALALKAYEQAFSITQNSALVIQIHSALSQSGKEKEANTRLIKWLAENPTDAQARLYIASVYLNKQQQDAAIKEYETIIQQHPEHAITLNNLAWLYQQKKDSRAVEYAERAYKLAPEAPAVLDTLGWILYEQGDIARAIPLLQKAASVAPNSAEIQYHFAVAIAKSGDNAKARTILEKLLASGNNFSQIDEAKDLLKQLK